MVLRRRKDRRKGSTPKTVSSVKTTEQQLFSIFFWYVTIAHDRWYFVPNAIFISDNGYTALSVDDNVHSVLYCSSCVFWTRRVFANKEFLGRFPWDERKSFSFPPNFSLEGGSHKNGNFVGISKFRGKCALWPTRAATKEMTARREIRYFGLHQRVSGLCARGITSPGVLEYFVSVIWRVSRMARQVPPQFLQTQN